MVVLGVISKSSSYWTIYNHGESMRFGLLPVFIGALVSGLLDVARYQQVLVW
jgi:hypothetical protein